MHVIWRFYRQVFRHKGLFLAFAVLWTACNLLYTLQPFFLKWITESVLISNYSYVWTLIIWYALALVASNIFASIAQVLADSALTKTGVDVQMSVMTQIHDLDFAYHTNKSSGKLISILRRGADALDNYFEVLNLQFSEILITFGVMLFAFSQVGVKYVVLALGITLLSLIVGTPVLKLNLKRRKEFTDIEDAVSAVKVDNLVNFDTVKYFAKEVYEQTRLRDLFKGYYKTAMALNYTFRYFDLSVGNLINLSLIGSLILVVMDLQSGNISLPEFVLITSFTAAFFPKLMHLLMLVRQLARRYSDLQSYYAILDEPVLIKDPANPQTISKLKGAINFSKISFVYPDGRGDVFKNLSLSVKPGESIALVGYSGSGKTTAVKLLMRMYDLNAGKITIDGVDISQMAKSYLRSLVGVVPQDPLLFNNTIRYNLSYSQPEASDQEIHEALEAVKLDKFVASLEFKDKTVVGERGIKLSGGQRQRLAIARVLLEQPPMVVFDEATSSLDSESERAIQEAFWNLVKDPKRPKTSIIIAHRLSTIMKTDKIIVLDKGQIAEQGSHRELLKKEGGIYKKLWELQQDGIIDNDADLLS